MKHLIKTIAKDILESISRAFHKNNIFSFKWGGEDIVLFLPNKREHIQQQIIVKNQFFQNEFLSEIKKYIKNNSIILDIGANIGNHAVFFGKIAKAKKIYCFEPNKDIFKVLLKNLELNNLSKNSKCYNFGLGSKKCSADIIINNPKRSLGEAHLKENQNGNIPIKRLDSININEPIDFIKIDVEGAEAEVLKGAIKILKKDHPKIVFEAHNKQCLEKVKKALNPFDYKIKKIDKSNFLAY